MGGLFDPFVLEMNVVLSKINCVVAHMPCGLKYHCSCVNIYISCSNAGHHYAVLVQCQCSQYIHTHTLYIISKYTHTCKNVQHLHIHICIPDMSVTVHVPFLQDITVAEVDNDISQTLSPM